MKTVRINIRLDEAIKAKVEKASVLLGFKNLSDYVVRLVDQDSSRVVAQHEIITLKDAVFDEFMAACEKAEAPNRALLEAVAFTEAQQFKE